MPTERATSGTGTGAEPQLLEGQRISTQDYEIRYWARTFGVTAEQLQRAIRQVGNGAADVRKHLRK